MNEVIYIGNNPEIFQEEPHTYNGTREYDLILTDGNFAVGLTRRGPKDKHVIYHILTEDDGSIFETKNPTNSWSSWWLNRHCTFLSKVEEYMKTHTEIFKPHEWGYDFI